MSSHRTILVHPAVDPDSGDEVDRRIARLTRLAENVFRRNDKAGRSANWAASARSR